MNSYTSNPHFRHGIFARASRKLGGKLRWFFQFGQTKRLFSYCSAPYPTREAAGVARDLALLQLCETGFKRRELCELIAPEESERRYNEGESAGPHFQNYVQRLRDATSNRRNVEPAPEPPPPAPEPHELDGLASLSPVAGWAEVSPGLFYSDAEVANWMFRSEVDKERGYAYARQKLSEKNRCPQP